jgi:DNA-directed RNA polymerase specialized sigma24 family protein
MQQGITATLEPGWLFDTHADGVFTLAYRTTRDRHLAEDVVQETFVKRFGRLEIPPDSKERIRRSLDLP